MHRFSTPTFEEIEETIPDPLAVIPAPVTMLPPARPVAKQGSRAEPTCLAGLLADCRRRGGGVDRASGADLCFQRMGTQQCRSGDSDVDSAPPPNRRPASAPANQQPKPTPAVDRDKSNNSGNQKTESNPPAGARQNGEHETAERQEKFSRRQDQKEKDQAKKKRPAKPESSSQTAVGGIDRTIAQEK